MKPDHDGDSKTDIAVWRSDSGAWFILSSKMPGSYTATQWGASKDEAILALTLILYSLNRGTAVTIVEAADLSFNNFEADK